MPKARMEAAVRLLAAMVAPPEEGTARVVALLHPSARFEMLGKSVSGAAAVADELLTGANSGLARRLQWQVPQRVGGHVRLVGERQAGTNDRGLVITLGFDGAAIDLVQQQRTPPPPPVASAIVLPPALRRMIDQALVERHPMLLAYTDADGQPVLSFRGSVQVHGDDSLAMWIRNAEGAFVRAIRANPRVALMYRNEDTKSTYQFQGRARVSLDESERRKVFGAAPPAERAHDFAMLGVPVVVELDRVEGYAGLGPAGQVDPIRMLRGAAA